ncbi:hypothetical protein GGX14DRAFT_405039 [Mycena pura]|uniref:DUF6534 domain-containing protein n=1 Tax=Mycena pura TaxID=153505 RepID=A0AAD6XZP2_9AGAR|nr:hypothetical protein GGX14DRAFT_405039 [Mycena pura]
MHGKLVDISDNLAQMSGKLGEITVRGIIWRDYPKLWGNKAQLPKEVFPDVSECMDHVPKVIAVVLCDTVQQALLCHAVYGYLVVRLRLLYNSESTPTDHGFTVGESTSSLISWSACVYTVKAVQLKAFADIISLQYRRYNSSFQKLGIAVNSLSAACDIVISIVLIFLLKLSKTGFKKSTALINKLIIFTFNTGILARSANQSQRSANRYISNCEQVAASPTTFIYIFFFLLLGRLYTNSLLVTLNSRDYITSASQSASGEQYSLDHTVRNATRVRNLYIPSTLHVSAHVFFKMPPRDQITIRIDKDTMHDFPLSSGDDLKSAPKANLNVAYYGRNHRNIP